MVFITVVAAVIAHFARARRRANLAAAAAGLWLAAATFGLAGAQEFELTYDLNKAPGAAADAPHVKAYGRNAHDGFGRVMRSGDINGDGIDDLIVGTPGADVGMPLRVDAGAVYIWFGKDSIAGSKDVAGSAGAAPDLVILGASAGDQLSRDGALLITEIDGDGVADIFVGALLADGPGEARTNAGEAYIIFGRSSETPFPPVIDLAVNGAPVTIHGASNDDQLTIGGAMAVGDINRDGINDVLLGSVLADGPAEGRNSAGEAYVIFGRPSKALWPQQIDLATQGPTGASVTIFGATAGDVLTFGGAIGVGDVNEDGALDIILGARDADGPNDSRSSCGEAYLVFGRTTFPATLDMGVQGSGGADVTLYGASAQDQLTSGGTLAVGDVNGDGFADLLLGALGGDGPDETRLSAGEAYIISGREVFPATLDLAIHGPAGASATIYGASGQDQLTSGGSLAIGDFNGDGFTDLLVGSPLADGPNESRTSAGEAYIILGGASFPEIMDLNPNSEGHHADVTIYGASADDNLTIEGALAVGDADGDGAADLLLGARLADGPGDGRLNGGEAYIVLGRNPFPATIDVAIKGIGGADVTVYGATLQDRLTSGAALAAGDINGDGFADFLIGSIFADGPAEARTDAGESYAIFGTGSLAIAPDIAVEQPAGTNIPDGGSRFGSILVGSSTTRTFTVRNTGLEMLTDLAVAVEGATAGDYAVGDLPATSLAPGGNLTFTVTFTPSVVGSRIALLRITSNDPNENPFDIVMTGNGTAPEIEVELSAGQGLATGHTHSFGAMHTGGAAVIAVTIRNAGGAELSGLALSSEGAHLQDFQVSSLTATSLPGNSSLSFSITFAPTDLGSRNATLFIASNDADENPFILHLSGTGKLPAPEIAVEQPAGNGRASEETVSFEAVPVGVAKNLTFTIRNAGSAALTGLALAKAGTHAAEYSVSAAGAATLVPGASTTFQVTFVPASAGVRTAVVEIASNDEDEDPFYLVLTGVGIDPEIVVEEPAGVDLPDGGSRTFGQVLVGQSQARTITVRNAGTTDLTGLELIKEGANPADFILGAPGSDTVAPGESTTFTIAFAPTARGPRSAVVRLGSNDADENPFDILVSGTGLAPEIAVAGPDGAELGDGNTVALPGAVIGTSTPPAVFVIRNLGNSPLSSLTLAQGDVPVADFALGPLSATKLAPGESATFSITFSPTIAGSKSATLLITSNEPHKGLLSLPLTADAYPKEPVFQPQSVVKWGIVGKPFEWRPFVTGAEPKTFLWYKGSTKMTGASATTSALSFSQLKGTDAAVYTLRVSNPFSAVPVISPDLHLATVTQAPPAVALNIGGNLKLTCTASVPPGAGLSYRWRRGQTPLTETLRVSGTQSKTLSIQGILPEEAGNYDCLVTMSLQALPYPATGGTTIVTVVQKPVVEPFALPDAFVGEEIAFPIPALNQPASFSVTGLPPGIVVTRTGVITGKPKAAKVVKGAVVPYDLKVSATNSAGKSAVISVPWKILPLEPGAIGSFHGLVARHSTLNGGLGGSIKLVTTTTGALSGTLVIGAQKLALAGSLTTPPGGGDPSVNLTIKRKAPSPPVTLEANINLQTGWLAGTVQGQASESTAVMALRSPWSTANKAAAYAFVHTAALTPDAAPLEGPSSRPQGEGYALLTVNPSGAAAWAGKLADGSSITGGVGVGPDGEVPLQVMLYANTGSVQGWSRLSSGGFWDSDGVIDWNKAEQPLNSSTRSYKEGIAQHELVLTGGRFVKPAGAILNLPPSPNPNARLRFFGGGLNGEIIQSFAITEKNAVQLPKPGVDNPASVSLSLTAATGVLSGSFQLLDPDPLDVTEPIAILKRTVPFHGVVVPRLGRGAGFFLMPKLPGVSGETLAKTPIFSGGLSLEPAAVE
jgi:hypothetical protein